MKKKLLIVAIIALVAMLGMVFVACNPDSYADKLEKKGYYVIMHEWDEPLDGVKWSIVARKHYYDENETLQMDEVRLYYFEDKEDAQETARMQQIINGKDRVYSSGKLVIIGSSVEALEDAK